MEKRKATREGIEGLQELYELVGTAQEQGYFYLPANTSPEFTRALREFRKAAENLAISIDKMGEWEEDLDEEIE